MISNVIGFFKNLDKLTYKIMKIGLSFCLSLAILSALILFTYNIASLSPHIYYIGIALFKLSCNFGVDFIICGLIMDSIAKQLI